MFSLHLPTTIQHPNRKKFFKNLKKIVRFRLGSNAIALNMVVDSVNFSVENAIYKVIGSNGTHSDSTEAVSKV